MVQLKISLAVVVLSSVSRVVVESADPPPPLVPLCPAGTYSKYDATKPVQTCDSCADGKYSNVVGAIFLTNDTTYVDPCKTCAAGQFSLGTIGPKGLVAPTSCVASCPAGTYSTFGTLPTTGPGYCDNCDTGTYSTAGQKACVACASSKYANYDPNSVYGSTSCLDQCPAGYAGVPLFNFCGPCDSGQYSAQAGTVGISCSTCASGKYSMSGATSCTLTQCPEGFYAFQGECNPCDAGKSAPAGSTDPAKCVTCDGGKYSSSGKPCTACAGGLFVPAANAGQSLCFQCYANTYSTSGSQACTACPAGLNSTKATGSCSGPPGPDSNAASCFSGDESVTLATGASKFFSEVEVGDQILTANAAGELSYAEVVFLPHGANNDVATFVELALASGKGVKATQMHLLKTCKGGLEYAQSLRVGDCLRTVDGDDVIASVSMTTAKGLYTAVTTNEFLVVNGIVASPFAVVHGVTHAYYNIHRTLYAVAPSILKFPGFASANALLGTSAALAFSLTASTN